MVRRPTARLVNGVASALAVAFFAVHGLLGGLGGVLSPDSPARWVPWLGVGIVGVHVVASVVTSHGQLTDAEFPPSPRKKRHLLLKWLSGAAVAAAVCAHVVCIQVFGPGSVRASTASAAAALALVAALAVHGWIGAKSLVTDLGLGKRRTCAFRIVLCVLAALVGAVVLAGIG